MLKSIDNNIVINCLLFIKYININGFFISFYMYRVNVQNLINHVQISRDVFKMIESREINSNFRSYNI